MDAPSASPMSYQPYLDKLTAFGSQESRKADLLEAKAEYFRLTGEVFDGRAAAHQRPPGHRSARVACA